MAIAVTLRQVSTSLACVTEPNEHLRRARRQEGRDVERAGFQRGACRVRQRVGFARLVEHDAPGLEAFGREVARDLGAADMEQRAVRGIEALAHELGQGRSASPDAEVTVPKPNPSAVAAVVSPTAKIGLLRCSLASASARAPLALVISTAWQSASDAGEVVGRMQNLQPEQRRHDRLMAARTERLGQCRRLAFRPGDQHAHDPPYPMRPQASSDECARAPSAARTVRVRG